MKNEQYYFHLFTYTLGLYFFLAVAVVLAFFFARKKNRRSLTLAAAIIFSVVLGDLALFVWQALPNETLLRKNIKFFEKSFIFSFPKARSDLPMPDERFRYFLSSAQNIFTAFDTITLSRLIPVATKKWRFADAGKMLDEIEAGGFIFQKEIKEMSLLEFINLGEANFSGWNNRQKQAYLNFLELSIEDMFYHEKFYSVFIDSRVFLNLLQKDILEGYKALHDGRPWASREEAIRIMNNMINLGLPVKPEAFAQVFNSSGLNPGAPVAQLINSHNVLFKQNSCFDYFLSLWARYRLWAVNTFVRFKDFDKIAKIFDESIANLRMQATNKRIKDDVGITSSIIKFFPCAYFAKEGEYISDLKLGSPKPGVLYIEEKPDKDDYLYAADAVQKPFVFNYSIEKYNPNYLKLNCQVDTAGYLYFSDGYDLYWKAKIDGKKTKIYKANSAFKAVKLPAGRHKLEFIYNPILFKLSLWLYYLATIFCVVFLVAKRKDARTFIRDGCHG